MNTQPRTLEGKSGGIDFGDPNQLTPKFLHTVKSACDINEGDVLPQYPRCKQTHYCGLLIEIKFSLFLTSVRPLLEGCEIDSFGDTVIKSKKT